MSGGSLLLMLLKHYFRKDEDVTTRYNQESAIIVGAFGAFLSSEKRSEERF